MRHVIAVFIFALVSFGSTDAWGQIERIERSYLGAAAFYNYSKPGEVTIYINVWGTVRFPGYYELPEGTTLQQMISFAGGPANNTFDPGRIRREQNITLSRNQSDGGSRQVIYEGRLDEIVDANSNMILVDGDVVFIETFDHERFNFRNWGTRILGAVSSGLAILLAVDRLWGQ